MASDNTRNQPTIRPELDTTLRWPADSSHRRRLPERPADKGAHMSAIHIARHICRQVEQHLEYLGCAVVEVGCPIDDLIAIWYDSAWHTWRSREPMRLINALGPKLGIVDPASAWVPTVKALSPDRSRLIVAVPVIEAHSPHSWPSTPAEVNYVDIDGAELGDFDPDQHLSNAQWEQLDDFIMMQLDHATQREEILNICPIHYRASNPPAICACSEPGVETEPGHGYFLEMSPTTDDPTRCELTGFRHGELDRIGSEICDVIKSWNISPLNVQTSSLSHLRVASSESSLSELNDAESLPSETRRS